jgi:protein-tyrosine phosphatase
MYLKKVIFICLGNICRSPSAEGVMKHLVKEKGLEDIIYVDSAGIMGYHTGDRADPRMRKHAMKRGYDLTSIARGFNPREDFDEFDYIIAMDSSNYNDLQSKDTGEKYKNKILMMTDFCRTVRAAEVPDPYYGGADGFELVLDILEDACEGLLERILNDLER